MSTRGYLVKILNEFPYKDGAAFAGAAYFPDGNGGGGWFPYRYKADGVCIQDANCSIKDFETFENYLTYTQTYIYYDHVTKTWSGSIKDLSGNQIVKLTNVESQERVLKLLQTGAQEKLLIIMRESGYVDEIDEGAA